MRCGIEGARRRFKVRERPYFSWFSSNSRLTITDQRPTDRTDASLDISRLQSQVRTLQARIIAEHVSRSTLEKDVVDQTEQAREYRTELANAVRALKRAKEETRKLDEERKKGLRLYEETRERCVEYVV
jgi:hypothetical protein